MIFKKIKRIFALETNNPDSRGAHAHKKCKQTFWCDRGSVDLICKDGKKENIFHLTPSFGMVYVPNGIWVEINIEENSHLVVFASHIYSEKDYLRDWSEFLKFRHQS